MQIVNVEQGTVEWKQARRCKVTGKRFDKMMGGVKPKLALIAELIAEEGTEQVKSNDRVSPEMERGTAEEPFAAALFEQTTGKKLFTAGLCVSNSMPWLANSPDRLIETSPAVFTEAVEFKCPNSDTVIYDRILNTMDLESIGYGSRPEPTKNNPTPDFTPFAGAPFCGVPSEYKWQCILYFIVNEHLKKLHFGVYDPRFIDDSLKLQIVTLDREDLRVQAAINNGLSELTSFYDLWQRCRAAVLPSSF